MRTLSVTQLAAQLLDTRTPYIGLTFTPPDGGTTYNYSFNPNASTNRLLKAEQEFDSEDLESKSAVHLSPKVISKLELAALLNSKKDELAEMVAKLLLPENSWGSIRPTIIVVRNQHKHSARTHREDVNELPVAAFSSGTGLERKQDFEAVMKAMNFVDLVHDLLLEHCGDVTDIKSELPKCVNNASALLHGIKLNKKANSEILKALSESLSADGE